MLIGGAKGFAKEILEILRQSDKLDSVAFYDDINQDIGDYLFDRFPVLKSPEEAKAFFEKYGKEFTVGIGNPPNRYKLYRLFESLGGIFTSVISPYARIGGFGVEIGEGVNIMTYAVLTTDIHVGKGSLINLAATVGHDVFMDEFVELAPAVNVSGKVSIGKFSFIGTGSVILPGVKIGNNVTVGAGAVVSKDLPDNAVAVGVPAKIIKFKKPL